MDGRFFSHLTKITIGWNILPWKSHPIKWECAKWSAHFQPLRYVKPLFKKGIFAPKLKIYALSKYIAVHFSMRKNWCGHMWCFNGQRKWGNYIQCIILAIWYRIYWNYTQHLVFIEQIIRCPDNEIIGLWQGLPHNFTFYLKMPWLLISSFLSAA